MIDKAEAFCSVSRVAEAPFLYDGSEAHDPLVFEDNDHV